MLDDDVKFCLYCGAPMQSEDNVYANQQEVYQNTGYANSPEQNGGYQQSSDYGNYDYNNPAYQQQYYDNANYANGYYQNQQNQQNPYGYQQVASQAVVAQPVAKEKKPMTKKQKVIFGLVGGLVAACFVLYLIFFAGRLTKSEAKEVVMEYLSDIEDFEVLEVVEDTVPDEVLKEAIKDINKEFDTNISYSDLKQYMEDDLQEELEDELDIYNPDIKFSNVKIKGVERFEFKNYVNRVDALIQDVAGEAPSAEELVGLVTDFEMTMEDLEKEFNEILKDYGIKSKDIYIVDLAFTVELETYHTGTVEYDSDELYMNHVIIYKYDDDWYLIPSVEGLLVPGLIKYTEKADKANDISSCKTIKTAVETALGNESIYEYLTNGEGDYAYIYITPDKATDSGESPITIKGGCKEDINGRTPSEIMSIAQEEIGQNIGEKTPSLKYTPNASMSGSNDVPTEYVVVITQRGMVYVYISVVDSGTMTVTDDSYYGTGAGDDGFQILPNICYEYQ